MNGSVWDKYIVDTRINSLELFLIEILTKEIIFPAFATAWDEEPVVVETNVVAAELVLAVAILLGRTGPLQQELVVVRWWGGLRQCFHNRLLVALIATQYISLSVCSSVCSFVTHLP